MIALVRLKLFGTDEYLDMELSNFDEEKGNYKIVFLDKEYLLSGEEMDKIKLVSRQ